MTEILWQDKDHVLCRACVISFPAFKPEDLDPENLMLLEAVKVDEPILFHQETGDVANQDFDSWIATDEITWWRPFGCMFRMIRHKINTTL